MVKRNKKYKRIRKRRFRYNDDLPRIRKPTAYETIEYNIKFYFTIIIIILIIYGISRLISLF